MGKHKPLNIGTYRIFPSPFRPATSLQLALMLQRGPAGIEVFADQDALLEKIW